jgi:thiamine-monophosphate kinase
MRLGAVAHAMLDVSDGLAVDAGHLAHRSECRLVIDLDAVPLAGVLDDLGFGEDFELLAATPDPLGFPVIGRCEEGEGIVLLHAGEPYDLPGYQHFV